MTRLETERLVLRLPLPEDAPAFYPLWQDAEAVRFVGGPKSQDEVDAMVERMIRHWDWFEIGNFTVEHRAEERILGRVGFLVWDPHDWSNGHRVRLEEPFETELGWKLDRGHWGRGFATEAALACRDWALNELGLKRLVSLIAHENRASIRVAEKIGESFERNIQGGFFRHAVELWSLGEPA